MLPLNVSGKDLVLELLNRENDLNLTHADVYFEPPVALVVPQGVRNTSVNVVRQLSSLYRNSKEVRYWRYVLSRVIKGADTTIPGFGFTSSYDIVAALKRLHDLQIENEDVIQETFTITSYPYTYKLKASAQSYAWLGEVEITITDGKIPLNTVVVKPLMSDYLNRLLELDTDRVIIGSVAGAIPTEPPIPTADFYRSNNSEVQVGLAVIQNDRVSKAEGTHNLLLNEQNQLAVTLGVFPNGRLPIGTPVTDYATCRIAIQSPSLTQLNLVLVYDPEVGVYQWLNADTGESVVAAEVVHYNFDGVCHSLLDLDQLIDTTGLFNLDVTLEARHTLVVPPFGYSFRLFRA